MGKENSNEGGRMVSVGDLIRMCNEASRKMGSRNPNKGLLLTCASAMNQLVDRLSELENPGGDSANIDGAGRYGH